MSLLSSIDTSQFTTPYTASQEISPFQPIQAIDDAKRETPNVAAEDEETPKVDLNSYYSNVLPPSTNNSLESDLAHVAEDFSNAVTSAVENGMNPQDAVYLQKAKTAYKAMINIVNNSNFELTV